MPTFGSGPKATDGSGRRSTNAPTRSRTPRRNWAEIEARRRWRRRRRRLSLENILSDIALPRSDVPVGVADIRVPDNRVHTKVAGLHRRISRAPVTWPLRVIVRTSGPGTLRARKARLGLGGACGQPQSSHHDIARQQRPGDDPLKSTMSHGRSVSGRLDDDPSVFASTDAYRAGIGLPESVRPGPGCRVSGSAVVAWLPSALSPSLRRYHRVPLGRRATGTPRCLLAEPIS
jgi:hypothetical protein